MKSAFFASKTRDEMSQKHVMKTGVYHKCTFSCEKVRLYYTNSVEKVRFIIDNSVGKV